MKKCQSDIILQQDIALIEKRTWNRMDSKYRSGKNTPSRGRKRKNKEFAKPCMWRRLVVQMKTLLRYQNQNENGE
jgi:hypothetical protein